MKAFITIILLTITLCGYSQTDLPIKFRANEEAKVSIGQAWDFSYSKMSRPLEVVFDGNNLKVSYLSGTIFYETVVSAHKIVEKEDRTTHILTVEDEDFIKYVLIEITQLTLGVTYTLKIPFIVNGALASYIYYQEMR